MGFTTSSDCFFFFFFTVVNSCSTVIVSTFLLGSVSVILIFFFGDTDSVSSNLPPFLLPPTLNPLCQTDIHVTLHVVSTDPIHSISSATFVLTFQILIMLSELLAVTNILSPSMSMHLTLVVCTSQLLNNFFSIKECI